MDQIPSHFRWSRIRFLITKAVLRAAAAVLAAVACWACSDTRWVDVVFFNLSGREIKVEAVAGLSSEPPIGYLAPTDSDSLTNRLHQVSATFAAPIRVSSKITIKWLEQGATKEAVLNGGTFGVPRVIRAGTVRLTYVGDGNWHITFLPSNI